MIDTFFANILEQMKPLREAEDDVDDKITMYKDLSIRFTKDKGKYLGDYKPEIGEDDTGNKHLVKYCKVGQETTTIASTAE